MDFFIFIPVAFPFFYINAYDGAQKHLVLDADTSKHIVQVLRMKPGEELNLTDGKGNLLTCAITDDNKKHCSVEVKQASYMKQDAGKVSIAISLLKTTSRFEWFLEKATELGINEIIPLVCERTAKEKFRYDRMQGICISAMLQSQQVWLPVLQEPRKFQDLKNWKSGNGKNFIAHCINQEKQRLPHSPSSTLPDSLICIGPEGDFTAGEIELALRHDFIPVSLGDTRLRTETAGVAAAVLLKLG